MRKHQVDSVRRWYNFREGILGILNQSKTSLQSRVGIADVSRTPAISAYFEVAISQKEAREKDDV